MKYAIFFTRIMLVLSAIAWTLNSCKKHPGMPHHGKPGEWLLSKIYYQRTSGDTAEKMLQDEYFYNNQRRPWRHIAYNITRGDTTRIDTFSYDGQQRLSTIKNRTINGRITTYTQLQLFYNAGNRIDSIIELSTNSSLRVDRFVHKFTYDGLFIIEGTDPPPSGTHFYYDGRGNLVERIEGARLDDPTTLNYTDKYELSDYDTCVNIYRFLNMNVYEPLKDPLLSKNNFQLYQTNTRGSVENGVYQLLNTVYTYEHVRDLNGLTVETFVKSSNSVTSFTLFYEYIR